MSSFVHHFKAIGEFKLELQSGNAQFGSKLVIFFAPVTSKFDRWPWKTIGHIFSATSSFVLHLIAIYQFKVEFQSGNPKFGSKSAIFVSRVTLKFNGWPWKTIGHLFYAPSSFVYHFIAFCEIKMKLQSGNTKFGSKSAIFLSRVTLKFYGWPWKTTGHFFYVPSSLVHHFISICEFKMELQYGNAKFGSKSAIFCPMWPWNWRMSLKNNRAPLLCYFKLCASFHSQLWIQTGVTVRKRLSYGFDLCDLELWPPTLTFCMDITSINGNNSWKFQDITMRGTWSKRCDGRTDGWTDRHYTLEYIIFPHIDNPQSTGYNQEKKPIKIINEKCEGPIDLTNHWRKKLWISLHVDLKRLN